MVYVPTDDLKRMSNMLLNNAEIIASNYCFAFIHDKPGDEEDVTSQLLKFFGEKIRETEEEQKAERSLKAHYLSSRQLSPTSQDQRS